MKRYLFFYLSILAMLVSLTPISSAQAEEVKSEGIFPFKIRLGSKPKAFEKVAFKAGTSGRYPWKQRIVTTTFWIGESPTANNPTPNHASSWDKNWARNYGGYDNPSTAYRRNYVPIKFTPRQNPFYVALPYNDISRSGTKPEVSRVIPWYARSFQRSGKTICKGRWVAVRKGTRVCYAQWEDCGPFRTDHWQYVFGNERPRANLNRGAGLDVSPAIRDYLGMGSTDVTDWKFVELSEVPRGPWSLYGENNPFVQQRRRFTDVVARKTLAENYSR